MSNPEKQSENIHTADRTARKMLKRHAEIQRQIGRLEKQADSLKMALALVGVDIEHPEEGRLTP